MTEAVSYERITGTVASLLFLFAEIENEARQILAGATGTDRLTRLHGARATLMAWKELVEAKGNIWPEESKLAACLWAKMQRPLDIRNGICHGLIGAMAERDGVQATLSWRVKHGIEVMKYSELQDMFAWLSKIPRALAMISQAIIEKDVSQVRPLPGPDFWASEFGIEIN